MKKRYLGVTLLALILLCGKVQANCSAAVTKYNTNLYKKFTIKKGSKIKLIQPVANKIKWKVSNKEIATISKKGVLKAKKCGKIRVVGKTSRKKYVCTVTIKKKVTKATAQNVFGKTEQINDESIDFVVYNKSDECITLTLPRLEYNENEIWKTESKKSGNVNIGVWPNIVILPRSKYQGNYNFSEYAMIHDKYRVVFHKVFIGPNFKQELKKPVYAAFEMK